MPETRDSETVEYVCDGCDHRWTAEYVEDALVLCPSCDEMLGYAL